MPRVQPETQALGLRFFAGNIDSASGRILARVHVRAGGYICLGNAHVTVTSWHEPAVKTALNEAWMVCPDGAPVAWLMRQLGARDAERIAGADLMARLFRVGQKDGVRHFLFGSTDHVLERLERTLRRRAPRAEFAGSYAPGPVLEDEPAPADMIAKIKSTRPDIIWCGLGAPKQELWMHRNARLLAPALLIGVGAAFDFHAGTKQRAPAWLQRAGLEWTHRLASEPRRLTGRYLRTNSEFIARAGAELISKRWSPQKYRPNPR